MDRFPSNDHSALEDDVRDYIDSMAAEDKLTGPFSEPPHATKNKTQGGRGKHVMLRDSLQDAELTRRKRENISRNDFEQWALNLGADDYVGLRKSLEGFLFNSNTSIERVAEWLNARSPHRQGYHESSPSVNEGLRSCLQEMMREQSGKPSGFKKWLGDEHGPISPSSSQASSRDGNDDFEPLTDIRLESPHVLRPISLTQQSATITTHLQRAQSIMRTTQLPEVDAAAEIAAGWGSTEDDDFVTPWYTYVIRFLMFPLGLLIFYFIFWRAYNYPRSGIWWADACAWTFIISEAICFLFGMTHWVWMWNLKFRKRVTQQELNLSDADLPTIDIMIPCYSEPTEIVEMTLKACYDMDYPAEKITCWICDDGAKEDMKNMVELISAEYRGKVKTRYVARVKVKGVPHHAKAGNLNNCILNEGSNGQLIIILDCDMLPEPCMARTVAPFFFKKIPVGVRSDPELGRRKAELDLDTGLLQTPQAFYNLDSQDLLGQSYGFFL
jgi:hypothetical protein